MMDWYDGGMSWAGVFGGLVMLIGLALAVVGVVALVRSHGGDSLAAGRRAPEQILDERLARGEIDVEEYIRCRGLLRSAH